MTTPDPAGPAGASGDGPAEASADGPAGASVAGDDSPAGRRLLRLELLIVFAITLGLSALRSLLSIVQSLLAPEPLSEQAVALNVSAAQADLIDLALQLLRVGQLFAWGGLGAYLLVRGGIRLRQVGLGRRIDARDLSYGFALAAVIGLPGLGFYLLTRAIGANLTVLPSALDDTWWRAPVLVLAAAANAWAEEVLMVGYLLTRLRQLRIGKAQALVISAVLRGAYHLYQGFGGFVGNVIMGLVFGWAWHKTNRLWPLVIAHTVIDVVAFVGYALLRDHLSWLP